MKRLIALVLAAGSLLSCLSAKEIYGKPWVNSDVEGNLPEQKARIQDDFALAANYDWLKEAKIPSNAGSLNFSYSISEENKSQIFSILEGKTASSHEEQLCQTLYKQALDWKTRNKLGIKPALPALKKLQKAKNIEELKALLSEKNSLYRSAYQFVYLNVDCKNCDVYLPDLSASFIMLPDADWYTDELSEDAQTYLAINTDYFSKVLVKFGYSEKDAAAMCEEIFNFEKKYASQCPGTTARSQRDYLSSIYNVYSKEELISKYPNIPLGAKIKNDGIDFISRINVSTPAAMEAINGVFTDENFNALKDFSIVCYVSSVVYCLDRECYDIAQNYINTLYGSSVQKSDREIAYDITDALAGMVIGKVWIEKFFKPEIKTDVTNITKDIVADFEKHIEKLDWMTAETKEKAIEKLHAIKYYIGYPDKWQDFSALKLPANYKKGSLLDSVKLISDYTFNRTVADIQKPVDKLTWSYTPQTINAFYDPQNNSINILGGILSGDAYQYDWPIEKKYAAIGTVIGHELTHGFDSSGAQFDKKGNMENWWTEDDLNAFIAKNNEIAEYYSTIEVGPGVMTNGYLCIGEIVADLGGFTFTLDLAKNKPDFDYDVYFRQYATLWREISPYESVKLQAMFNEHPISYIRVNASFQRFQEFYDTYDVKEGDGMYLAPEKRILIW